MTSQPRLMGTSLPNIRKTSRQHHEDIPAQPLKYSPSQSHEVSPAQLHEDLLAKHSQNKDIVAAKDQIDRLWREGNFHDTRIENLKRLILDLESHS